MPMYDYRCNACQREFEYQQKMSDDDLVKCEACGEDKLEKLISWSAFKMGGADWTKQISGKMTGGQQRDVARSLVDKGSPPSQEEKAAARAAKNAAIDAATGRATASPAAEAPTTETTTAPDTTGTKE